jgi:iron complex outermembrane receptor protein
MTQGGARLDWHLPSAKVTLQGDYFVNHTDGRLLVPNTSVPGVPPSPVNVATRFSGGNILARYERTFSDESDLKLQAYYDSFRQTDDAFATSHKQEIVDVDFQHRFPLPFNQSVIYGFGYRYNPTTLGDSAIFKYTVHDRGLQTASGFLQDEIRFLDDRLKLNLGTKVERNDHTGWEFQPNARLAYLPTTQQTIWTSVSRAVQIPGRSYRDIASVPFALPSLPPAFPGAGPTVLRGVSNPNLKAQELMSYELGYRIRPNDRLTLDLTTYYNRYEKLVGPALPPGFTVGFAPNPSFVNFAAANNNHAELFGGELSALWHAKKSWRLQASYSYLHESRWPDHTDEKRDASNMASLRSSWDLPGNLELDMTARFVDSLRLGEIDGSSTTSTPTRTSTCVSAGTPRATSSSPSPAKTSLRPSATNSTATASAAPKPAPFPAASSRT